MIRSFMMRLRHDADIRGFVAHGWVLYVAGGASLTLTLAQQLLTARFLGAAEYGRLAASLAFVLLALLAVDVRTWELGTRLLASPLDERAFGEASRRFSWLLAAEVACGVAGVALVMAMAPIIAGSILHEDTYGLLVILALVIPMRQVGVGVSISTLRMLERFDWLAARSICTAVIRLLAIAGPAAVGWGTSAVAVGVLVAESVAALSASILAASAFRRTSGISILTTARPDCLPDATRLARDLWVSASIKGLHVESFIPIAAAFTSPAQVGTLRTGLDIASMMTHATAPVGMIVGPRIVLLSQARNRSRLNGYLAFVRRLLLLIVAPCVAIGIPFVYFGLPEIVGADFVSVRVVAVLLMVGFAASVLTLWVRHLLVGLDRVAAQNRLGVVTGLISVAVLPVLVSRWGAFGAAVDLTGFLIVYAFLSSQVARKALDDAK